MPYNEFNLDLLGHIEKTILNIQILLESLSSAVLFAYHFISRFGYSLSLTN